MKFTTIIAAVLSLATFAVAAPVAVPVPETGGEDPLLPP
jgi:hypothetical protein